MANLKNWKKIAIGLVFFMIVSISIALGLHNAKIYAPSHGFDGVGHVFYIEYIYKNWKMPPPNLNWETHQSPLYYFIGALLMTITKTWKTAQYMNIFILWLIVIMTGLGLKKVFKKNEVVFIGMFSLAALPMLNIFPAMITNELLNTFWIISTIVSTLFLIAGKNSKEFIMAIIWLNLSLVLGIWTKMSIVVALPVIFCAFIIIFFKNKTNRIRTVIFFVISVAIFILAYYPIFSRSRTAEGPSNIVSSISSLAKFKTKRPIDFFIRLDWITKIDMYNTQYYSFLGGAWNSFWSDGQNAITPFVKFHKKAFILWVLGFILLPICIYGLVSMWKKNKFSSIIIYVTTVTMLGMYLAYNIISSHYSAVRLTYEMGIILPYAFGIAAASMNKKLKPFIIFFLLIQFVVMVSFFWIQPWWHVTK